MADVPVSESPEKRESRGLMKRIASGFGVKVSATGFGFLLNLIVARLLGPAGTGYYGLAQSASVFGATFGKLGMDNTVIRLVAQRSVDEQHAVVSVMRRCLLICAAISGLMTVGLWVFASPVARYILDDPTGADVVRLVSIATAPLALSTLIAQGLIGLKRTNEGIVVNLLVMPAVGCLLSLALIPFFKLDGAIYAYTISALAALFYGQFLWKRATAGLKGDAPAPTREILASCLPLFAVSLVQYFLKWSPVFLIKYWSTVADVGIYNLALRTAFLLAFVLTAVNATTSPIYSQLYAKGEYEEMGDLARRCAQAMGLIALVPLLIFLVFNRQVMGLYGPAFKAGGATLAVISVGQYINVATGSVQQLLTMTGHEKYISRLFASLLIPYFLLMWWLTPPYGALGAGIATATIMVVQNLACVYFVKKTLGIWTLPTRHDLAKVPRMLKRGGLRKLLR